MLVTVIRDTQIGQILVTIPSIVYLVFSRETQDCQLSTKCCLLLPSEAILEDCVLLVRTVVHLEGI